MRKRTHAASLRLVVDNSSDARISTPADAQAASNRKCQDPGTDRRVFHLAVCQSEAPADRAASAICGQRLSENKSIPTSMDILSNVSRTEIRLQDGLSTQNYGVPRKSAAPRSRSEFRDRFRKRIKDARERALLSQAQVAHLLGVTLSTYQKMEQRGSMQVDQIEPFAVIVGEDAWFILTGRRDRDPAGPLPFRRLA